MGKIWGIQVYDGMNIGDSNTKTVMDSYREKTQAEKDRTLAEKDAIEPPMLSPDDLIGSGIPTKVAMLAKAGASALAGKVALVGMMDRNLFLQKNPEFAGTMFKDEEGLIQELYHGTSKDKPFKSFAPNRRGNFVGTDREIASSYAKDNDSQRVVYENGKFSDINTSANVRPLFVNVQSPYYLEGEELKQYVKTSNYAKMQRDIMDKAKAMGHDAVIYPDGGIAVANPKQIKSSLTGD